MDRALRRLAVLSLVAAVVLYVVEKTRPPLDDLNVRDQLTFYFLREPLFGQTSLLLAVAVGVATVTVAVWRGQRAWVSIVLVALLVVANGAIVFFFSLSGAALFAFFTALPFLAFASLQQAGAMLRLAVVPALLPLLALAYTRWPRRAPASEPIPTASVSPASTRRITTERTLRLLAVLALLVVLSIIPFVAYVASDSSIQSGASGQRLLGLWGPMLGQTSYLLTFGVGVAALTDAVWRRQRAWAWGLLVTLLVVAYGYILFNYLYYSVVFGLVAVGHLDTLLKGLPDWLLQQYPSASLLDPPLTSSSGNLLRDVIIPALLPLVVLAYTVRPQRMGSTSSSGSETAPSQLPTTTTGQVEPLS